MISLILIRQSKKRGSIRPSFPLTFTIMIESPSWLEFQKLIVYSALLSNFFTHFNTGQHIFFISNPFIES